LAELRVAVVGTGGIAQRHLRVLRTLPDVRVLGHVSRSAERAHAQATEFGGRAFVDVDELLRHETPDAVWICVTPDGHGALEHALIDRGVPFFVEKPLSVDTATAEQIAVLVAESGLVSGVGYKLRALDTLPRARELLLETPPRMVFAAWHDRMPPPHWWHHAAQSGGQIIEQATHVLDLARMLVGEATVVSGWGRRWPRRDAPDSDVLGVSMALLRFSTSDGDIPGCVSATCLLSGLHAAHVQLVCDGRVVTLSERALVVETGREREEYPTGLDPVQVEDVAFLDAVRAGQPEGALCSYADALDTHRLACAVQDALVNSTHETS
jgi:predicted dehydrogenase